MARRSVNEAIVRVRDTQELYERACRIAVEQGLLRLAWVGERPAEERRLGRRSRRARSSQVWSR